VVNGADIPKIEKLLSEKVAEVKEVKWIIPPTGRGILKN
jgi:hypothetical protein